jgi:polyisoprenoid-binding protein YceI
MTKFQIQKASSHVNWTGKKVLGLHTGTINIADGYIEMDDSKQIKGDIVIDMDSIIITDISDKKTNQEFLAHLRNDDFFSVDKYKTASLSITQSTQIASNQWKLDGILKIKDITHPISFIANIDIFHESLHSMGEITIDRTLYNIRYGSGKFIQGLGDKLIYDDFILQFKIIAQTIN